LTIFAHSVGSSFRGQKKLSVKPVYGPHSATYAESGVVQH